MNKAEYCEFINQYRKQLYVLAYTILENKMDAEDAVCNGILRGYEHLGQLKDSRKLKSWLTVITKNEALKIKEKRILLPGNEKLEGLLEPVIVLFYYNEMSVKEIAHVLEIPVGTVKSRLNRGREFLKKELENWEGNMYESR